MLSLASLNIERSKHLDRVVPFLRERQPDVVCLQELMEYDIPLFEEALGGTMYLFVPQTRHPGEGRAAPMGLGICSRLPAHRTHVEYYVGNAEAVPDFDATNVETKHASERRAVAMCDVEKDGVQFRIADVHFTWTPDGEPDDFQREDMGKLLAILDGAGEFVLCGDFNAPRGGEIYGELAERYRDCIPERYKTSLDLNLHRAGKTKAHELADKLVDYIFATPAYTVSGVELVSGVSDHCAVVATVSAMG